MTFTIRKTYRQTRKVVVEQVECIDRAAFLFIIGKWNMLGVDIWEIEEVSA